VPISGDVSRLTKWASTDTQTDPSWMVDFGEEGVPIKELLVVGVTDNHFDLSKGLKIHVGDHLDFHRNPSCTVTTFDAHRGAEVSCGLEGRYITIVRPGKLNVLMLAGVSISVDCSKLPWDEVTGFPLDLPFNETTSIYVPLATKFESHLGVDVCGQLQVQLEGLPSFCSQVVNEIIECTPDSEEHVGEHRFTIN